MCTTVRVLYILCLLVSVLGEDVSFFVCYHLHLCPLRPAKCIIPHAEPPRCVARGVGGKTVDDERKKRLP